MHHILGVEGTMWTEGTPQPEILPICSFPASWRGRSGVVARKRAIGTVPGTAARAQARLTAAASATIQTSALELGSQVLSQTVALRYADCLLVKLGRPS